MLSALEDCSDVTTGAHLGGVRGEPETGGAAPRGVFVLLAFMLGVLAVLAAMRVLVLTGIGRIGQDVGRADAHGGCLASVWRSQNILECSALCVIVCYAFRASAVLQAELHED